MKASLSGHEIALMYMHTTIRRRLLVAEEGG